MNIFESLISGKSLVDNDLPVEGGRLVVENIRSPRIKAIKEYAVGLLNIQQTSGFPTAQRVNWKQIHFRHCDLSNVRLFSCIVEDCVFEGCKLQSFGLWESQVNRCLFSDCNLREAVLGGIFWDRPHPNLYARTEFLRSDLRETAHSCETYERCKFVNCRTDNLDFMGSVFKECAFTGVLEDTTFRASEAKSSKFYRNSMLGCDLSRANLRSCQFLGIDMSGMVLPEDSELLRLPHGPQDLARWALLMPEEGSERKRWYLNQLQQEMGVPGLFSLELAQGIFSPQDIHELRVLLKDIT